MGEILITDDVSGHRKRVCEKFKKGYAEFATDYELLEYLLFKVVPRKDTKQLAKKLATTFNGVAGLMSTSKENLLMVDGVGNEIATYIGAITELSKRGMAKNIKKIKLSNQAEIQQYIYSMFSYNTNEKMLEICIAEDFNIIATYEFDNKATSTSVHIDGAQICKKAINSGAKYVILAHNHTDMIEFVEPSTVDIISTKELIMKLSTLNIVLADHIIVNNCGDIFSFRDSGMLENIYTLLNKRYDEIQSLKSNLLIVSSNNARYTLDRLKAEIGDLMKL